jgi:hypothetical protein
MKKFFAIAILTIATLTANAQAWLGGSVGLDWEKGKWDHAEANSTWEIAPEIGYDLDETWAVAIKLGIVSKKQGDNDAVTGFIINPYARYKFANIDKVTFFLDGGLAYKTYGKHAGNSFGIGIKPGLAYKVADGVSLEAKFGGLGWTTFSEEAGDYNKFGIGVDTEAILFGIFFDI